MKIQNLKKKKKLNNSADLEQVKLNLKKKKNKTRKKKI